MGGSQSDLAWVSIKVATVFCILAASVAPVAEDAQPVLMLHYQHGGPPLPQLGPPF
jgi:hypothetical protein